VAEFVDIDMMPQLKDLLSELLDVEEGLTSWQVDFIESLSNWDGRFTVGQAEKLQQVHRDIF
jgi:hypothetical protein